ncbi:hypothetical protein [Aquimarina intermedia]|uniref:Copper chaperone NosL n=1 Tax=Aquimarina intermedia TaxID=350814 RepID=A0A5S5CCB7_9FLAO|nr:hypothetical protein [Aquimarina intermedia]TYP77005.1 hypothetical protein BD809_101151 [Aquimarina intermedia]
MLANKNIIASLLLVFFSCIQIADLHALDHEVDDVDCKICQFAADQKAESYLPSQDIGVPQTLDVYTGVLPLQYHVVVYTNTSFDNLQNKAPPVA